MATEFENLIHDVPPELQPICRELRAAVAKLHPGFVELIWPKQGIASYGVGPKKMSEHYVYIAPQTRHVNLGFYHGAALKDPAGLLEGSGKKLRHIKIGDPAQIQAEPIGQLITEAIAERHRALGR